MQTSTPTPSTPTLGRTASPSVILAIYKTEGRSYIDAEFSPQEYGVATKKGSDFSTLCDDLIKGWLADGTIDQLIKDNGLD